MKINRHCLTIAFDPSWVSKFSGFAGAGQVDVDIAYYIDRLVIAFSGPKDKMPKNIALFIDGTWDRPNGACDTNVVKLFQACVYWDRGHTPQLTYYLPGVGTDLSDARDGSEIGIDGRHRFHKLRPPRVDRWPWIRGFFNKLLGGAAGYGTEHRILEAYSYLCANYQLGDRIFIFGFSRGAFAARSLAGFAATVGVLLRTRPALVLQAYKLYEKKGGENELAEFLRTRLDRVDLELSSEEQLPIHFLGVWDTVGAVGKLSRTVRFKADTTEYGTSDLPPNVFVARHAMSLHELRADFRLMSWYDGKGKDLQQVWFPGDHADVGGGHPLHQSGYSRSALIWMAEEACKRGLLVDRIYQAIVCQTNSFKIPKRVFHQAPLWWFCVGRAMPREQLSWMSGDLPTGATAPGFAIDLSYGREHLPEAALHYRLNWKLRLRGIVTELKFVDKRATGSQG